MNTVEINTTITKQLFDSAMNYDEYMQLLLDLFEEGKTTGSNQSEDMLNYAKMNLQRMKRLNKTASLNQGLVDLLSANKTSMKWLVLTEGWCGDAAQNLPVIHKIAETSPLIDLKLILRDENLEVMDEFLTNGGRSIPKLIALNTETMEVLGTWGPRPKEVQEMMIEFKKDPKGDYSEFNKTVQLWYAKNKTESIQLEMTNQLKKWTFNGQ